MMIVQVKVNLLGQMAQFTKETFLMDRCMVRANSLTPKAILKKESLSTTNSKAEYLM